MVRSYPPMQLDAGGIAAAVSKMAFGNGLGAVINAQS